MNQIDNLKTSSSDTKAASFPTSVTPVPLRQGRAKSKAQSKSRPRSPKRRSKKAAGWRTYIWNKQAHRRTWPWYLKAKPDHPQHPRCTQIRHQNYNPLVTRNWVLLDACMNEGMATAELCLWELKLKRYDAATIETECLGLVDKAMKWAMYSPRANQTTSQSDFLNKFKQRIRFGARGVLKEYGLFRNAKLRFEPDDDDDFVIVQVAAPRVIAGRDLFKELLQQQHDEEFKTWVLVMLQLCLTEREGICVVQKYFELKKHREIAPLIGKSPNQIGAKAVENHLRRARKKISEHFAFKNGQVVQIQPFASHRLGRPPKTKDAS